MDDESEHLDLSVTIGRASFTGAGPSDRVMAALERFTELLATAPGTVADEVSEGESADDAHEPPAPPRSTGVAAGEAVGLPEFLHNTNPSGNQMIATAIVAWAMLHDSKPTLSPSDVKELWRQTSFPAPGNVNRDMRAAVSGRLLHRAGNRYTVTGHGRQRLGLTTR
jgi:hypothetical protein